MGTKACMSGLLVVLAVGCAFIDDFGRFEARDATRGDAGPDGGMTDPGEGDGSTPDPGGFDAGEPDAGPLDPGGFDAGEPDAGPPDPGGFDAGTDAGATGAGRDAGAIDAGEPDAGPPDLACVDGVLGDPPIEQAVDLTEHADDYAGTCGGSGAADVAYQWTAPRDDFYRFHTTGSDFETVLYLRDGDCDADELACNDQQSGPFRSEIVQRLDQWQRVVAVVDGRSGDSGNATLNVEAVQCPALQLTDAILPVNHGTAGRDPYPEEDTCLSDEHGARSYRFTAPEDGHYSFLAVRDVEDFRPAIRFEQGPVCGGPWQQCNSSTHGRAEVQRYLAAGEHATVIVGGHEEDGSFTLEAERRGGDSCIDAEIVADAWNQWPDLTGELFPGDPHRMTTSCGNPRQWDFSDPDNVDFLPDFNIRIVPTDETASGCTFGCFMNIEADFLFFASLSEVDAHDMCAGRELSCAEAEHVSGTSPPRYTTSFEVSLDGIHRILTIDRDLPAPTGLLEGPEFEVSFTCSGLCS